MNTYRYRVIIKGENDGGYYAFCPSLQGCHSQGDTLAEASANIREAIELYIESLRAHNEPLPAEDPPSNQRKGRPPYE